MEPLSFLRQYSDWALLAVRIVVALVFFSHGSAKLKGAKGFYFGLGAWEVLWSIAVLLGFLGHYAGVALGLVMVGATYMKMAKWKMPLVGQDKTGYELDLTLLALSLVLLTLGSGALSLDAVLWK